eukprot:m.35127 g.35127  ORF g.35127 m.35127 type:complete len:440 (-) comp5299_c0_seq1:227-1546(-)
MSEIEELFLQGVRAVSADRFLRPVLQRDGAMLRVIPPGQQAISVPLDRNVVVLAFGKAVLRMLHVVCGLLEDHITQGIASVPFEHKDMTVSPSNKITLYFGSPKNTADAVACEAARKMLDLVRGLKVSDIVLVLVSGGGSALLPLPPDGVTVADKAAASTLLSRAGATINELNTFRKHMSLIKGGQLAAATKAQVFSFIVSDVIGDDIGIIASGPTVADSSTFADAVSICHRRGVWDSLPASVRGWLQAGESGRVPETPKAIANAVNILVANSGLALRAIADRAAAQGYAVECLTSTLQGDACAAAAWLVGQARARTGRVCLLAGGETTVTVRGHGRGGRSQELALKAALLLRGTTGITLLAAGTDGQDGPTDAAGAIVDGRTISSAEQHGLDGLAYLADNDSYTFFARAGGLIKCGPTDTNVMDLCIVLVDNPPDKMA